MTDLAARSPPQPDESPGRERFAATPGFIKLVNDGSMSQVICVAAQLHIADALANGPRNVEELARETQAHAPSLHRLMRALASLEICTEREDGSFSLTPMGSLLRADAPDSLRSWAIWYGTYMRPVWGELLYSVKTGQNARKLLTGTDAFGHLERDDEVAAVFNRAMAEFTRLVASEVVRAYDFTGMRRIVDVGGGYGALIGALLAAYPHTHGELLDLPHAIEGARAHLENAGLAKRCELIAGDFFTSVPADADVYLLKAVIHDWDDERSAVILRNCRRAVGKDGKLLLIERVMPRRIEACPLHHAIARADLNMLVALGGRERNEEEFAELLASSGFKLARLLATESEYSILECVPS
jgi:SAM-dependent methyltransferase